MSERVLVCVAWPYVNYLLHVGQVAGAYLPADVFARFERMAGREVLMVSGSDCHGTPITVAAEEAGVEPNEIVERYHPKILEVWEKLGITWDNYTTTLTDNHYATTQEVFTRLLEEDLLYTAKQDQLFDAEANRFLPDRYVEGTCPKCGYKEARGDQCDSCGSQLDATDLINPTSRMTGNRPEVRETEHFFLRLTALEERLKEYVGGQSHWRRNVQNSSLGMLTEGLKDRAITRDITWGVPLPVDGYDSKRIYVWFDAVIGYLSATREWATKQGTPDAWRDWWEDSDTHHYYFIGKDNIVFHTIIWPAMLLGYGGLNLAYDVPANQYVNFAPGQKQSKSKGTGTWMVDLLDRYDPDAVRFYLTSIFPETSDSEFREEDLIRFNNEVLIATWGNLANRVIAMTHRYFEGIVPEPGDLSPESQAIIQQAEEAFDAIGAHYHGCQFRAALQECLKLAQSANKYLDDRAPWKAAKTDSAHAAETLSTALNVINALKVLFHPILPFSTAKLHAALAPDAPDELMWEYQPVSPGTQLEKPSPLYIKLDLLEEDE